MATVLIACSAGSLRVHAQLPAIELRALSRTAATVGGDVELRLVAGNRLEEVDALRFSDPSITAELLTKPPLPRTETPMPDYGHFRVKIPDGTAPGRIEVRAVGRYGVSNPRILRVTERSCSVIESTSHDRQQPHEFPRGDLLLARCTPAEIDYYSVPVEQGESLRIRLAAQTIDSRMIGQLTLFDGRGNTVVSARGSDGMDPELTVPSKQSGRYTLAVHDFLYRGGNEYPYQLTLVSDEESVDSTSQLEHRRRHHQLLTHSNKDRSSGRLPEQTDPNTVGLRTLGDPKGKIEWLPSGGEAGNGEREFQPPCRVAGTFDATRGSVDEEHFIRFTAKKEQRLALEIFSERLHQATDVRLTVERLKSSESQPPQWERLHIIDDSQPTADGPISLRTSDPHLMFQSPAAATYRAVIRDLDTGTSLSSRQNFVLDIREPNPGFELLAFSPTFDKGSKQFRPSGVHLVRGGAVPFRVLVLRRDGWTGPVKLNIEGLPGGVSCPPVWIPATRNQGQINVVADVDAKSWIGSIEVVGRATVAENESTRKAIPATVQWAKSNSRPFARSRITSDLALAVSDQDTCPLTVRWGDAEPRTATPGSTLKVLVQLTRREGSTTGCTLRPQDLPPGVSAGEVKVAADQTEATIELKISEDAAVGTYTPWLQAETKVAWQPNPQRLERAEQYRDLLQRQLADAESEDERAAIEAALKVAGQRIEKAKPAAKSQEITLDLPSDHMTFQVVPQ